MKPKTVNLSILIFAILLLISCAAPVSSLKDVESALVDYRKGKKDKLKDLIDILENKDNPAEVRIAAAEALGETRDPGAIIALIKTVKELQKLSIQLEIAAVRILGETKNPSATEPLLEVLSSSREKYREIRNTILAAVQKTSDEKTVIALIEAIEESKEDFYLLQKNVSRALAAIGDEKAVPALINIAKDEDIDITVRSRAIEILGAKKDPDLVPFFLDMLSSPKTQLQVRDFALQAVKDVKSEKLILLLLEAFQQGRDEYLQLTNALAAALGALGDVRAAPTLVKIAKDKNLNFQVRKTAISNLKKLQNPNIVMDLLEMMRDPDNYLFYDVVYETIKELSGERGIEALREAEADAQAQYYQKFRRRAPTK
ncbi:MAG: HEAT repeat domain-containing protein [Fidelibacterota bacterium]